jgi:hypothetical protein
MDNHELNRELKKILESLQEVPERNLQDIHVGRENFLAQVRSLKPRGRASRKSARQGSSPGRRAWATRFAAIAAVIVVAISSLGGTIYAAQAAQPDDLLYGVKTLTEEIQVRLEGDPEDKLDLYVSFANRRMQEIKNQIAAGEQVSEKALTLLEQHTQNMLEQAAKLHEFGMNKAMRQIQENLQEQNQLMEQLGKEHPQGSPPGLLQTQEEIRERHENVENSIREPKGFREQIRTELIEKENNGKEPGNQDPQQGNPNNGGQNGTEQPGNNSGNGQGEK